MWKIYSIIQTYLNEINRISGVVQSLFLLLFHFPQYFLLENNFLFNYLVTTVEIGAETQIATSWYKTFVTGVPKWKCAYEL
jgi:hypothetical protein